MTQTQALVIKRHEHNQKDRRLVLQGDAIRDRIIEVITGRFRHRNDDGTIFTPRISGSLVFPGVAQVIVLDPNRLWHFSIARMTNQDTLDQMQLATGKPVRAIRKIPAGAMGNREAREVLAYAVLLKDNIGAAIGAGAAGKALRQPTLPKMADMDFLSHKPVGDYMIGLGVGESGEVWTSLPDALHIALIGTTGSGKSAAVRSFVYQLSKMSQPVELYLSDLEDVTFPWAEHWPIVKGYAKTPEGAVANMTRLITEMDHRSELYRATGKFPDSWQEYRAVTGKELPWIVAIFEEASATADLVGKSSQFMSNLRQLVWRGRKFGITVVLSGQDFKADLFPTNVSGKIKTRLVFRTDTAQESRNALGEDGAEQISDKSPGRCIMRQNGKLIHVQGFWVPKSVVLGEDSGGAAQATGPQAQAERVLSRLTPVEAKLVLYAVENLDGWFLIDALTKAFDGKPSGYELRDIALRWKVLGWLEDGRKPNANGRGSTPSRHVTDALAQMARGQLA